MPSGADLFVVCKQCQAEVSPYITECPYCGARLRKRAPKLDRARPAPRGARVAAPSLGRLRRGEIPGIRPDRRPYATLALVAGSLTVPLLWQAGVFELSQLAVLGKLGHEWWRVLTASFAYGNSGYLLVSLVGIALFGWLLERRHGPLVVLVVFLAGGAGGMLVASVAESSAVALGGNAAALALLCAWAVPDLQDRRRGTETESDLLGVGLIAAVLLLLPLAISDADPLAGGTGALIGLLLGMPLAALSRAR